MAPRKALLVAFTLAAAPLRAHATARGAVNAHGPALLAASPALCAQQASREVRPWRGRGFVFPEEASQAPGEARRAG